MPGSWEKSKKPCFIIIVIFFGHEQKGLTSSYARDPDEEGGDLNWTEWTQ